MLDLLLALTSPRPTRLVVLAPGIDACKRRNAMRPVYEQFEFDGYAELEADMKRDLDDVAWWFDTSALTPEATAEQLIREAAARAAPLRRGWG
jgi:hypothetical protein